MLARSANVAKVFREIVDPGQRLDPGRGHIFRDDAARDAHLSRLGDSISIDDYTGVPGGGAPSQLARKLGVELVDLARDGNKTEGVLGDVARAPAAADIVTLSAGGNDLLLGDRTGAVLRRLHQIAERIQPLGARVVVRRAGFRPADRPDPRRRARSDMACRARSTAR